ncbi:TonB family protein [Aurantiacibacter marinus]|uniref:TonB family protein n=1 Tax=Aurantiacibacter marinus TaxID=874156 RepID=UPI000699DCF5|nr:TonB family protein [Aurantiacibacter marinus]
MKNLNIAKIALASAGIALSAPLAAQDRSQDQDNILVQPTSEDARFATRLSRQLDTNLSRYSFPLRLDPTGIVRVRFIANGAGVAENMTIVGESGSNQLDRAALWAVRRLDNISPPHMAGFSEGRVIQANIVFAQSERQAARLFAQLEREETARMALARERGDAPVLALTLATATRAH